MQEKILIADDEADIVAMLSDYFTLNGYRVLAAHSGAQAVVFAAECPDLILLDVNMPELDGFSVCRKIRDFVSCPILFLTARIEDCDKIQGFGAGGDDYIVKPFSLEELRARVEAHLRREKRQRVSSFVKFESGLCIDYTARAVFREGESLALTPKEFDIIELLSVNGGQVFDRERIYERVWGYDSEGDSAVVAEHIRRIRQKLARPGEPIPIETVWGVGYRWKK